MNYSWSSKAFLYIQQQSTTKTNWELTSCRLKQALFLPKMAIFALKQHVLPICFHKNVEKYALKSLDDTLIYLHHCIQGNSVIGISPWQVCHRSWANIWYKSSMIWQTISLISCSILKQLKKVFHFYLWSHSELKIATSQGPEATKIQPWLPDFRIQGPIAT